MPTFDQFIFSLRQEFGEQDAGKKFEVFCKWFLENDPEWSKTVDKVWLWDEYPNKWQRQDLGTDLVFRDNEGLIWAVQAKCYSEHRSTTKGDMNSFLADTGRKEVDRRLWLQSTNKIEAKAEKTLKGQDKPVTVFMLNDFREAQIDYPSSFADLYQAKVKDKPKPDPHQIKAIEDAASGLKLSDRGQMIMACGTGKTFTTLWIKEALEAHTTLVLLPSLSLLSQTMREWAWAGNTDFDILNVCSDKSVGKKTEDMDPADAPFPVTSEVEKIVEFLKHPKPKVVFCTYQSSDLIAQAQLDSSVPTFDLAVADEAHRCAGKADAGFATILDADKIRASKRLFTTATPRYFGKAIKDEAKARDLAVVGMDNETVFGPVIHKLTFGQAIEQELLTDYQVVIVGVNEPMVREWIENYEIVSTDPDNQTDARTLAAKIGLLKAVKDYDLKRVISFHSRVAGAKQFSDELVDVLNLIEPANRPEGKFLSDYVSGAMKAGDRKEKIDRLKVLEGYDRGILTNARCLAEGVDVPSLDGVAFIDPKGSQVDIIQAVGRAIRKVRGAKVQKKGMIVLPVFIEDGDDHEASIEASNFKPVWGVLKALRAHDEVLADVLDQYRTNMAKNTSQSRESISGRVIFGIPNSLSNEFSIALRTVLVENTTASWEFWYGLLEVFSEKEGHCNVPLDYITAKNFRLGTWVISQRARRSHLKMERINKLDAIGFKWSLQNHNWQMNFEALQRFVQKEGHCNVPTRFIIEGGGDLGRWVTMQRLQRNELEISKQEKLEGIGFHWTSWDRRFSELMEYYQLNGHCKIPQNYKTNDEYGLGRWVALQRMSKNKLSKIQIQKLSEINFPWTIWDQNYLILREYYEVEGHCSLPADYKTQDGFGLGVWVARQRRNKKKLNENQYAKMNEINFSWTKQDIRADKAWINFHKLLINFKSREGHCNMDPNHIENGFKLGLQVKSVQKNVSLSVVRRKLLVNLGLIPFAQDYSENKDQTIDAKWLMRFDQLQAFHAREGHCNLPQNYKAEDGFWLGHWVYRQRKMDILFPEQKQRLDDIGFIWDASKDKT